MAPPATNRTQPRSSTLSTSETFAVSNSTSKHFLGGQQRSWMTANGIIPQQGHSLPTPLGNTRLSQTIPRTLVRSPSSTNHAPGVTVVSPSKTTIVAIPRNISQPNEDDLDNSQQTGRGLEFQQERNIDQTLNNTFPQSTDWDIQRVGNPGLGLQTPSAWMEGTIRSTFVEGVVLTSQNVASPIITEESTSVPTTTSSNSGSYINLGPQSLFPSLQPVGNQIVQKRPLSSDTQRVVRAKTSLSSNTNINPGRIVSTSQVSTPVQQSIPTGLVYRQQLQSIVDKLRIRSEYTNLEHDRVIMLDEACYRNDPFLLILHQVYCLVSLNSNLQKQLGFSPAHMKGFMAMTQVLMPNGLLDRESIRVFAAFPFPPTQLPVIGELIWYLDQIKTFLLKFDQNWSILLRNCVSRGYPPCARELFSIFSLHSPVFQKQLYQWIFNFIPENDDQEWKRHALRYFDINQHFHIQDFSQLGGPRWEVQNQNAEMNEIHQFGQEYFKLRARLASEALVVPGRQANNIQNHTRVNSIPNATSSRQNEVPNKSNMNDLGRSQISPHHPYPHDQTLQSNVQYHGQIQYTVHPEHVQRRNPADSIRNLTNFQYGAAGPTHNGTAIIQPTPQRVQGDGIQFNLRSTTTFLPRSNFQNPQLNAQANNPKVSRMFIPPPDTRMSLISNPDPDRVALHQAYLQSPDVRKVNVQDVVDPELRLYRYVDHFAIEPLPLGVRCPYFLWNFQILPAEENKIAKTVGESVMDRYRIFKNESTMYRLRCVQNREEMDQAKLVVEPTTWPSFCFIAVNTTPLEIRRKSHHGKDLPVDITSHVKEGINKIEMSIQRGPPDQKKTFLVIIEVIRVVNHDTALSIPSKVGAENVLSNITRSMNSSEIDEDLQLVDPHISIDLFDPFMSTIFKIPVRGKTCIHRECFDLEAFLQSRTSKIKGGPTDPDEWKCPICKKDARPSSLVIDGFLAEVRKVLEEMNSLNATAILVDAEGKWEPKMEKISEITRRSRSHGREMSESEKTPNTDMVPIFQPPTPNRVIELDA